MYSKQLNIKILSWLTFLMFTSGYTNCISIFYLGIPLSHHTGNLTNIAIDISAGSKDVFLVIGAISSFFISGVISGATFYKKHVGFSRIFGVMAIVQSIIYIILNYLFPSKTMLILSTAFILGAQNSLLTRYNGITTRTTHLTGYISDCSINLGRALKGDTASFNNFIFFLINIIAFFVGTVIGVLTVNSISVRSFYYVAVLRIISSTFYLVFINKKDIHQKLLKNN